MAERAKAATTPTATGCAFKAPIGERGVRCKGVVISVKFITEAYSWCARPPGLPEKCCTAVSTSGAHNRSVLPFSDRLCRTSFHLDYRRGIRSALGRAEEKPIVRKERRLDGCLTGTSGRWFESFDRMEFDEAPRVHAGHKFLMRKPIRLERVLKD